MKTFTMLIAVMLVANGCARLKEKAYSGIDREKWQNSERVIETLAIRPGIRVADLGAGAGYFSLKFAKVVTENGIVYAVDNDPDMIQLLESKIQEGNLRNMKVIQARSDDSLLPERAVDLIFLCDSYHEMSDRIPYFRGLKSKLSKNGKLAIIDLKPHGAYGLFGFHGTTTETISREMKAAGYKLDASYDFLPEQNFMVFSPEE